MHKKIAYGPSIALALFRSSGGIYGADDNYDGYYSAGDTGVLGGFTSDDRLPAKSRITSFRRPSAPIDSFS